MQVEVARNLAAAKARLAQLRSEHAAHLGSLRQSVHDHREALDAARAHNASLESQVRAPAPYSNNGVSGSEGESGMAVAGAACVTAA